MEPTASRASAWPGSSGQRLTLDASTLRSLVRECFERLAINAQDAAAVADVLLYANARGIDSHGIDRVPVYMRRVAAGAAGGTERMSLVAEHGSLRRIDAGHALGPAAGVKAIDAAIALARRHGVGVVVLGNASNFAAAGYYALRAARAGCLAMVTTNTPPIMAPHGASEAFVGSNPIALAAPMGGHDELVLDMSTTVVARGKIRRASSSGTPLERGWALDDNGDPTTDADRAIAGSLLPFAGPKGSGLALAISVFLALLTGSDFDDEVASIYADATTPQNLGQMFLVIDPTPVGDGARWRDRCDTLIRRMRGLRHQAGFAEVRYPGEGAAERARERFEHGIPVEASDLRAIASACLDCGLPDVADRARMLASA